MFDLDLAYARARDELVAQPITGRALVARPLELELAEVDLAAWLADLSRRLEDGSYRAGPITIYDAPKGAGLVRPASQITLEDRVAYTAAVGACLPAIDAATRWSQGKTDFAMRLDPAKLQHRKWFRSPFKGWSEFNERSLRYLNRKRTTDVVLGDIAGYFENISLELLRSDLERIGSPSLAVTVIERCLREWAQSPDRGLPQGVLASDVLAKLYLESLDRALLNAGLRHVRYVDDVRIFCDSPEAGRRALVTLTQRCRARGLTLQSAKTRVHTAASVREQFEGVGPAIHSVNRAYLQRAIAQGLLAGDESVPLVAIDDLLSRDPDAVDMTVIRRAFVEYWVGAPSPGQTILRYTLNRLGKANDQFGVTECERLLVDCPEHTPTVLRYFSSLSRKAPARKILLRTLKGRGSATFPYQRVLILDWYVRTAGKPNAPELSALRAFAFSPESPQSCRALARQVVGQHGNQGDLEALVETYRSASDPLERAQTLACLARLERRRRNALAGRSRDDHGWLGRAARLVRRDR